MRSCLFIRLKNVRQLNTFFRLFLHRREALGAYSSTLIGLLQLYRRIILWVLTRLFGKLPFQEIEAGRMFFQETLGHDLRGQSLQEPYL